MASTSIPNEVKKQVDDIVKRFNESEIGDPHCLYVPRYRGRFLYLDREDYGRLSQVCRLEYTGDLKAWNFAIYKYSSESYDDDEWFLGYCAHLPVIVR